MSDTEPAAHLSIPETFARLQSRGQVPPLRRTSGCYEFDLEGGGHWFLTLDHGMPSVQANVDHPRCTVKCDGADFVDIVEGRRNMVTAYLRGDLDCSGDLAFALTFRHLVPPAA